ncbi:DNA polymerase I [Candidatus Kuenenbacteria bacterium]|nr:DNA polymerase I [Candidatus Kuenenbacteria bacterium]
MKKEKIAIIDANAIVHRAFHALPPLMTKDGVLVNAVYGFANILLKVLKDIKPEYVAVCFDVSKETFRLEMYKEYKAQREKQPDELYSQIDLVKEMIGAFNMSIFAVKGFEADDLIGTIVKKIQNFNVKQNPKSKIQKGNEIESVVVTGDMDTLQLIGDNTKVYTLKKGIADTIIYDETAVRARYGFGPEAMVDYKALRGDPSDNIPGVKGIGEKTATELIKEFGTLEKVYEYVEQTQNPKSKFLIKSKIQNQKDLKIKGAVLEKLMEHKKEAFLSKELATIKTDVPMKFDLEGCRVRPFDAPKIVELFQAWNFKSLIARIPAAEKELTRGQGSLFAKREETREERKVDFEIGKGYILVDSQEKVERFLVELGKQKIFAIDTETNGLDPFQADLIGISFSFEEGKGYYLPVGRNFQFSIFNFQLLLNKLKQILADGGIKKVGHNIKFDMETLAGAGLELKGVEFDTMVASYLLNPGTRQHNLDAVVFTEFGYEMTPIESLIGKGKDQITMDKVELNRVADYAIEDADYTWRLYKRLDKQLIKNKLRELMDKIETPLISVLAEIEKNGVLVDVKFLGKMSREAGERIKELEKKIYKMAGREFNVRSPIQLKEVLFDEMGISRLGLAKTKTGTSTAAAELDKLQGVHPIIDLILEHRELSKLKSTYTDALPELINPKTGRIHASFNQTVTATGRLSSSEPNLQNIPIRTELGKKIRQAFVAPKGFKIVTIDYSQIELRIAASMSGDKKMLQAFKNSEDIHRRTAAEVFGVKPEAVTPEMRRKAKEVNFGVLYGLGARGLAQRTGTSYEEAMLFIEKYFEIFGDLKNYLEETIEQAHENEYVETLFGRKRYLPEINAEHQQLRAAAERMAVNQPIQGTAADLMKLAMIKIDEMLKKDKLGEIKMVLQVHDELVFEAPDNMAEVIGKKMKETMESVYKFKCPIVAEMSIGNNWGECK